MTEALFVVAVSNFDAVVIIYLMAVAIIGFIILFLSAGELGKRSVPDSSNALA